MKLGLTVFGIAARLARWRIARAREDAIRSALRSLSEQRQQQLAQETDRSTKRPTANGTDKKGRS